MSIQRIMVVDDDTLSREFLVEAITQLGYQPIAAKSGNEALEQAKKELPDLVLTDLRMPGFDGMDLVKALKASYPDLPAVMITAQGTIEAAVQAMRSGVEDFLLKPCTPDAIEVVIGRIDRTTRLMRENQYLRSEISSATPQSLVAKSQPMLETLRNASRVARSKGTVLITGESGTGKEKIAQYIHQNSPRANGPFIRVNCAALSEQLLESELFGHERGAFTGAHKMREGRFELADGGTLLLDEIGEITPALQAKLLRVLEEEEFERVGGTSTLKVDVRVLATTNRDLQAEMKAGRFREDLYYRLHVLPVHIRPLRERSEDIVPLAQHFAEFYAKQAGLDVPNFTPAAHECLSAWHWPGNVRELENVVQRAVVMLRQSTIDMADLSFGPAKSGQGSSGGPESQVAAAAFSAAAGVPTQDLGPALANRTIEEIERVAILATLNSTKNNKTEAARRLGVTARTLSNKMKLWRSTGLVA
ncbi:MAG: sigma-54-dependent Fis family transcriptional regulator [Planctomycetes bacterium]|nr:sigma-54-dependent Fis family transcriptional regulator [Planctomycetota bacterium]